MDDRTERTELDPWPVLARYARPYRPAERPALLGNAGGASGAQIWKCHAASGWLALRAWPGGGPTPGRLDQIHAWLREASRTGLVPLPIPALDGRTVQEHCGRLWQLEPWVPGEPISIEHATIDRIQSMFAALAALHRAWAGREMTTMPSPNLRARVAEIESLIRVGFDRIEEALAGAREDRAHACPAASWLREARRVAPAVLAFVQEAVELAVPLQPVLRDARPEHFLFEGPELRGVVDFGAIDVDTVVTDLARMSLDWPGEREGWRAAALAAYEEWRPISSAERRVMTALEATAAVLGGARWATWHFLDRRRFDDPRIVAEGLERGLARLRAWGRLGPRDRA